MCSVLAHSILCSLDNKQVNRRVHRIHQIVVNVKSPSSEGKEKALRKSKGKEPATGSSGKSTSREGATWGKCGGAERREWR